MPGPPERVDAAASASDAQKIDNVELGSPQDPSTYQRRRSGSGSSASNPEVDNVLSNPTKGKGSDPPLPEEEAPPLPDEAPPEDDGWDAVWDNTARAYYFYNYYTQQGQWENPRLPEVTKSYERYASSGAPGTSSTSGAPGTSSPPKRTYGGYNPAIHGSYDPNADYAVEARRQEEEEEAAAAAMATGVPASTDTYGATGHFNRFTGKFQNSSITPENYNDENKSKRQMSAFFDVDAAANSHDGKSLREERRNKPLSKKQLKAYQEKKRAKKEHNRRAWLKD